MGQNLVSGGVNVPCQHATPVANVLWKPHISRKKGRVREKGHGLV